MTSLRERLMNKWATWDTRARLYCYATEEERESVSDIIDIDIAKFVSILGKDYCLLFLKQLPDSQNALKKFYTELREIQSDPLYKIRLKSVLKLIEHENTPDVIDSEFYSIFSKNKVINLSRNSGFNSLDMLWFFWIVEDIGGGKYKLICDYDRSVFSMEDLEFLLFNKELSYRSIFRIYCNFNDKQREIFDKEEIYPRMKTILDTLGFGRVWNLGFDRKRLEQEMNYVNNVLYKKFLPKFTDYMSTYGQQTDTLIELYKQIDSEEILTSEKRKIKQKDDMIFDLSLLCPRKFSYNPISAYNFKYLI